MNYNGKSKSELIAELAQRDTRIAELEKLAVSHQQADQQNNGDTENECPVHKIEDVYRMMIDNARESIHVVQDSLLKYANPSTLYGGATSLEKMAPINVFSFIHPDDREMVAENYRRTLEGAVLSPYCYRMRSEHGNIAWKEITAIRIMWEGRPAVLVFTTDVTERVKMEEALRKSERQLSDIINFLPDATFAIDNNGVVIVWNRVIEQLSGISADDIVGKGEFAYSIPFYRHRRPMLIDLVLSPGQDAVKSYPSFGKMGEDLFAEAIIEHDGRIQHLWCKASAIYDHNENVIGAIESIRDITELKKTEEKLKANTQNLEEANTALKVLLRHREEDRGEIEDRVMNNMRKLILPYVEKLKNSKLDDNQTMFVSILEKHLEELVSPFLSKMSVYSYNFTPREIEIASLIKDGKTTKEIGEILNISTSTVNIYRNSIRCKLNLNKKKVNLQSYLSSMST